MKAGILGPPERPDPGLLDPEMQRLYFDVISRVADPAAANGSPLVYQWRFSDADPWHLVIDNGSTRAEPGEAPEPDADPRERAGPTGSPSGKPDANPLKMLLQRRIRPRGSIRELARMRKVFRLALGDRRARVRPGPLGLELGGEREQGRLVAGAADRSGPPAACRRRRSRPAPTSPGCRGGSRGRSRDRSGSSRAPCAARRWPSQRRTGSAVPPITGVISTS